MLKNTMGTYKEINARIDFTLDAIGTVMGRRFERPHPFITEKLYCKEAIGLFNPFENELRLRRRTVSSEGEMRDWTISHEVGHYIQHVYTSEYERKQIFRQKLMRLRYARDSGTAVTKMFEKTDISAMKLGNFVNMHWLNREDFLWSARHEGFADFVAAYTVSECTDPVEKSIDLIRRLSNQRRAPHPAGQSLIREVLDYYDTMVMEQDVMRSFQKRRASLHSLNWMRSIRDAYWDRNYDRNDKGRFYWRDAYRHGQTLYVYLLAASGFNPDLLLRQVASDIAKDDGYFALNRRISDTGEIRFALEQMAKHLESEGILSLAYLLSDSALLKGLER